MFGQSEAGSPRDSLANDLAEVEVAPRSRSSFAIAEIEEVMSGQCVARLELDQERITILAHDMSQLGQDVLRLQEAVGLADGQDGLRDRIAFLENDTSRRLALLEKDGRDVADRHLKHAIGVQAANDKQSSVLSACKESLCKRMESIEEIVKESDTKQMRMCADWQRSYDTIVSLLRDREEHKVDHALLPDRLGLVEEQLRGSVDKMNNMGLDLWRSVDDLRRAHTEDAAFHDRVASSDSELGHLVELHSRELCECQTRLDKATKELANLEGNNATIAERTAASERHLADAADELARMSEDSRATRARELHDLNTVRERLVLQASEHIDVLRGELLRHKTSTDLRFGACERLLHQKLSSPQDRIHTVTAELQREVATKTAWVNKLTSSASSPSLSLASSPKTGPSRQSSPLSLSPQEARAPWWSRAQGGWGELSSPK